MDILRHLVCSGRAALVLIGGVAALGCGGDDSGAQSATGRAYDALAKAVASCAGQLSSCRSGAGARSGGSATCQGNFETCALTSGTEWEAALIDATSDCLAVSQTCDSRAGDDPAAQLKCDQGLRSCLGSASPPSGRATFTSSGSTSTYQCFGQLRECITAEAAPKACSAAARECVIHAFSEPGRPPGPGGVAGAAGRGAAGRGSIVAGRGGSAGRSGLAGRTGGRNQNEAGSGGGAAAAGRGSTGRRGGRN
jgi:hypothetical protein